MNMATLSTRRGLATTAVVTALVLSSFGARGSARPTTGSATGDILFVATRNHPFAGQLYAINPDGSGRRRVPTGSKLPWGARWAPDGRHIAFEAGASSPSARDAIFLIAPDGTRRVRIAQDSYPSNFAGTRPGVSFAWSPNGSRLAYSVIEDGKPRLYIGDLTGKKLVDLTPPEGASPTTSLGEVTWSRGGWVGFFRFAGDPATSNCCSLTYELVRSSGKGLRRILRIYDYPHDGPGISWSPN